MKHPLASCLDNRFSPYLTQRSKSDVKPYKNKVEVTMFASMKKQSMSNSLRLARLKKGHHVSKFALLSPCDFDTTTDTNIS
jgi:hypothetical protein